MIPAGWEANTVGPTTVLSQLTSWTAAQGRRPRGNMTHPVQETEQRFREAKMTRVYKGRVLERREISRQRSEDTKKVPSSFQLSTDQRTHVRNWLSQKEETPKGVEQQSPGLHSTEATGVPSCQRENRALTRHLAVENQPDAKGCSLLP